MVRPELLGMRALVGLITTYLLCVLLVGLTPVGTGDSVHGDQLLHPVFPHVHLVDGHLVVHVHDTAAPSTPSAVQANPHPAGPVLGADADAATAFASDALLPPPPVPRPLILPDLPNPMWRLSDDPAPRSWSEPPPDPPPSFTA